MQWIHDLVFIWSENLSLKDKWVSVVILHFLEHLDFEKLSEIVDEASGISFWIMVHTFGWFYHDDTGRKSQINENPYFQKIISQLSFIVFQDNFSRDKICWDFPELLKKDIFSEKQFVCDYASICEISDKKTAWNSMNIAYVWLTGSHKGIQILGDLVLEQGNILKQKGIRFLWFTHTDMSQREARKEEIMWLEFTCNEHDKKRIYKDIDVLIIPSLWNETWPRVLYEAFANKIPVIVSDQPSLVEKVKDRKDSYVFKTGDKRDLLKWILWMQQNYQRLSRKGEGFVYNPIENYNKKFEEFLQNL